ncbi:MAG TPA: T9SS type A sorting domain-containing protein [Saprospiraceae bacterium]|nr:T9SS type A sorting domain-containing protein [Saprospiraceae bacterium]
MKLWFTKFTFCISQLFTFCVVLNGQQNGGFENWSPSGSPPPFDWKYPTGWTTNNATTEFISAGVTRSTVKHSGTYAAQVKTLNIFGTLTRSQLSLGKGKLDYPHYQVAPNTGGEPLAMIPHEVSFFYQLSIDSPAEYAVAEILVKRPSGSTVPETVFHESVMLPAVDIYTEVKVQIPEAGINIATDSIVILFSSNDTSEVGNNILFVDDVSIDFTSANQPAPKMLADISIYPNPLHSGQEIVIKNSSAEIHDISLTDLSGKLVRCFGNFSHAGLEIHLPALDLCPGVYVLVLNNIVRKPVVVSRGF